MLASSFIFGDKGFIRLQKTNIKDEYRHIFFKFSKQCDYHRSLLDWQRLTPETTFGLLVDKVGGMTFWKQISQAFLTLSLTLFSTFRFFLALLLRATLHYLNAWNRLFKFSMDATCFCVGRRTITFPSHLCYHISVLPCFRYVSVTYFFLFFNPCPRSHDHCFRNFAFATYQGE